MSARSAVALGLGLAGLGMLASGGYIHAKAALAQMLLTRAWDATRAGGAEIRPWPWADTWPVGRLRVAAHGIDVVVLEDASGSTLAFAPGRLLGSARVGASGNVVIAGHRDTHFAFLRELSGGDQILLEGPRGRARSYVVREFRVVHESDTALLESGAGPSLTLITCWPFGSPVPGGPLRYAAIATQAGNSASGAVGAVLRAAARDDVQRKGGQEEPERWTGE